jgi:hypothetical protein
LLESQYTECTITDSKEHYNHLEMEHTHRKMTTQAVRTGQQIESVKRSRPNNEENYKIIILDSEE